MADLLKTQQTIRNTINVMSVRESSSSISLRPIVPHFNRLQDSMTTLVSSYRTFRDVWFFHVQEIECNTLYLTSELEELVKNGRQILNMWNSCTVHHNCANALTWTGSEKKNAECNLIRDRRAKINVLRRDYIAMMSFKASVLGNEGAALLREVDELYGKIQAVMGSYYRAREMKMKRKGEIKGEREWYGMNDLMDSAGKRARNQAEKEMENDLKVLKGLKVLAKSLKERIARDRRVWEEVVVQCEEFGGKVGIGMGMGKSAVITVTADGNVLTKERSEEISRTFDTVEKWIKERKKFAEVLVGM